MRASRKWMLVGVFALTSACRTADESNRRTAEGSDFPQVAVGLDSVVLRDSADMFIAEPAGVALSRHSIFVADAGSASILQFDRRGVLVRRIGRRGRGPGEFSAPGALAILGDTALVVSDIGTGRVSLFHIETGRFLLMKRFPGSPFTISVLGDTLLAGTFDAVQTSSMYRVVISDSSGLAMGPISADYATGRRLKYTYPFSAATLTAGGAVVAMVGSRQLYRTDAKGAVRDSIVLGSRVRRGVPPDLERLLADVKQPGDEMLLVSILTALTSLGTSTAMVHIDFTPQGASVSGKAFLSLVRWDTHLQCVDASVPLAPDTRPVFAFRGDTLVSVQNVLQGGDTLTSATHVRFHRVPLCGRPSVQ